MRDEIPYLSDEELERLILQVEEHELVAAPPDLRERILLCSESMKKENTSRDKNIEFYHYCFRVITSAVAAIAIIFGLPHMEVKPKAEVLLKQEVLKESITREEVLNEKKIFSRIFNQMDDFESEDK